MSIRSFSSVWLAGFTVVLCGCTAQNQSFEAPPPEVIVAFPVQQPIVSYVEQTGTAQATERVELRPRVAGYLHERKFSDGDFVEAGQLLFVIDEEPFRVKLDYARARENEAKSNLLRAKQSKAREIAQAKLTLAQSERQLALINHERNIGLLGQNALSRQEYDKTEAALRAADATIQENEAEVEQSKVTYDTNLLSAEAALALADSEVRAAEIDLGYCRITAPISGVIDRRSVDVGNYISADNSTILATIVSIDPIYAYAAISEDELIRLKKRYPDLRGDAVVPVLMGIGENREFPYQGVIDYVAPSVQAATGTVQIRGEFTHAGMVMPGMFIRIRVPAEEIPDAILVSERSLGYDQAGTYVYVVNHEEKIERRSVVPGDAIDGKRVVSGDIKMGEQVMADGLLKVRPGMKVKPKLREETESPAEKVAGQ
ncbi:efflux RND transporter periplasmic adaptor subunit [Planctomicrobium sp. SH661]|uniref:efflux RND transporter periplasmic adaptor subunit n=1 Tax=Planctomicrobium sp. SH661 TaxID=3448124 RepID=UPI003F5B8BAE